MKKKINKFIMKILYWFWKRKKKPVTTSTANLEERYIPPAPFTKVGHGRAFNNNRKRTKGRRIQVINMGKYARVIYHEAF
jgi:hypothetical protein